jgi:hypothetical protein
MGRDWLDDEGMLPGRERWVQQWHSPEVLHEHTRPKASSSVLSMIKRNQRGLTVHVEGYPAAF